MTDGKISVKIFLDLFVWLFALLGIFIILECRFPGFVITHVNLSLWFLATLVAGGIYLSLKDSSS